MIKNKYYIGQQVRNSLTCGVFTIRKISESGGCVFYSANDFTTAHPEHRLEPARGDKNIIQQGSDSNKEHSFIPKNVIICSIKHYNVIRKLFPHRQVKPDGWCGEDHFFWFTKTGQIRKFNVKTAVISTTDHKKGFPYMKPLRYLSSYYYRPIAQEHGL